ncbi:hypothetical protein RZN05_17895 [Sphingomonas sp. HF-S4]|uniref:Uncharacterized protein n=1 Tax=Sphingomonas agrestis TaxID=3080540 RepID=A0ABU3YBV1_9SPHN|nr:hypothetical protein [Sphingomonas sp. HF-S4]MDV3458875.1 hypothetical protein [Sphingomonas sp. HF-S4]
MKRILKTGADAAPSPALPAGYDSRERGCDPWKIAWNPVWTIDAQGHVTFGV